MELVLALALIVITALVAVGATMLAFAVLIVRAATRMSAPPQAGTDVLSPWAEQEQLRRQDASTASPDDRSAMRDVEASAANDPAYETRQPDRCALCETIRRALGLRASDLTRKN